MQILQNKQTKKTNHNKPKQTPTTGKQPLKAPTKPPNSCSFACVSPKATSRTGNSSLGLPFIKQKEKTEVVKNAAEVLMFMLLFKMYLVLYP